MTNYIVRGRKALQNDDVINTDDKSSGYNDVMRRPSGEGRDDLTADQVLDVAAKHIFWFLKNSALFVRFNGLVTWFLKEGDPL